MFVLLVVFMEFFRYFQINSLYSRVQKILRPYYDAIGKLNIEEGPEKQFKEAREAYREGRPSALPGKFTKQFNRLVKSIVRCLSLHKFLVCFKKIIFENVIRHFLFSSDRGRIDNI